jgi:integrase
MAKLGKIIQLNQRNEDKHVYGTIHTFLLRKGQDSENTKDAYERSIRDFFRTMRNKELEELVPEDLVFSKKQIEAYQVALREQYKAKTVNGALSAIRECYKRLEEDGFNVDVKWFNVERYDEHDSEKYGTLTFEEVIAILDFVSKTRKGNEKALLIRLAYATAFRKDSLLEMKWNQIVKINDIWYAKVLGKGNKWSHKKLSADLYNALMEFKGDAKDEEKIFQLTDKTIKLMMKKIREQFDFGDRHIVFHSFKKASINEVNVITGGDIKAMQAHGDHANAQTMLNYYLADKALEDLVEVDINRHIPVEKFDEMSHEELLALVKGMDRATQIRLLLKAGAM